MHYDTPRVPATHLGRMTPFEQRASREWGLSLLDARALLVIVKRIWVTCANLGEELWGGARRERGGNCSCPWARPAGVVVKRLRALDLVERHPGERARIAYRITSKVEALIAETGKLAKAGSGLKSRRDGKAVRAR